MTTLPDMAAKIRAASERRQEMMRARQALQQEYADMKEQFEQNKAARTRSYVHALIISAIFLAIPLFEVSINVLHVGACFLLNALYVLCVHELSQWMNIAIMILLNVVLLQKVDTLPQISSMLRELPLKTTIRCLCANAATLVLLYVFYVRRSPKAKDIAANMSLEGVPATMANNKKLVDEKGSHTRRTEMDDILAYAEQRERSRRWDYSASIVILCNFAYLLVTGHISILLLMNAVTKLLGRG